MSEEEGGWPSWNEEMVMFDADRRRRHVEDIGARILRASRHGYIEEQSAAWGEAEEFGLTPDVTEWLRD